VRTIAAGSVAVKINTSSQPSSARTSGWRRITGAMTEPPLATSTSGEVTVIDWPSTSIVKRAGGCRSASVAAGR
jgi:hypothetical protein